MSRRSIISPAVAATAGVIALGAVVPAVAAGSGKVTIRIEGAKRTLLATKTIQVPASGWITSFGAPTGACPAASAAGVLNAATKGSWSGTWDSKYNDYFPVSTILGDTENVSKSYFEILVNNVPASTGPCEIRLKPGDQLLFGAVPLSGKGYPLVIKAPKTATKGSSLKVTVDYVNGKAKSAALAGATVTGGGVTATTNAKGIATLKLKRSGRLTLSASKAGDIRAATVTVRVAS